jgi:hypothetical protein
MFLIMFSRYSYLLCIVLFSIGFSACRDRKNVSDPDKQNEDRIIVSMEVRSLHPDRFELYYHEKDESFSADKRIIQEVKGSGEFEKLEFRLEPLVFPSRLRIDLGQNPAQEVISLKKLVFRYNDATHEFTREEVQKYFRPNSYVDFDFEAMQAKMKSEDGKYDPFLVSYDISYFVNKLILF